MERYSSPQPKELDRNIADWRSGLPSTVPITAATVISTESALFLQGVRRATIAHSTKTTGEKGKVPPILPSPAGRR